MSGMPERHPGRRRALQILHRQEQAAKSLGSCETGDDFAFIFNSF
jgi:hypothetical protein